MNEQLLPNMTDLNDMNIDITPCENIADIVSRSDFVELKMSPFHKEQISALMQYVPSMIAATSLSNAYTVNFPKGVEGHLMKYKTGGYGTSIQGADGNIITHASMQRLSGQAVLLGAFNTMAIASGQYFLSEINSKLERISLSLDKILEFLYGEKRAELMAEISFTKYAYENYNSIMECDTQRSATIVGLQEAKKIAMKDMEFYMADLDSTTNTKDVSDIIGLVNKAFQIKSSIEFSVQLYVMATVLEMYYAQNFNSGYIDYIESEMQMYINKCDKLILTDFGALNIHISSFKDKVLVNKILAKPVDKEQLLKRVSSVIERLGSGEESKLQRSLRNALRAPNKSSEYCISSDGVVYLKRA